MIYFGHTAQLMLNRNLEARAYAKCRGYFIDRDTWVAFDNRNGNCYVEEFSTEGTAICWLLQIFEMSEIESFKVVKITPELYFIPNEGFLSVRFDKEAIHCEIHPLTFTETIAAG